MDEQSATYLYNGILSEIKSNKLQHMQQHGWLTKALYQWGQTQKTTYCMIPHIWLPWKGNIVGPQSRSANAWDQEWEEGIKCKGKGGLLGVMEREVSIFWVLWGLYYHVHLSELIKHCIPQMGELTAESGIWIQLTCFMHIHMHTYTYWTCLERMEPWVREVR